MSLKKQTVEYKWVSLEGRVHSPIFTIVAQAGEISGKIYLFTIFVQFI